MPFSVNPRARQGDTDTIQLSVQTSTLGATPNPWDLVLLVSVAGAGNGLPGNFETHLYYNLPPADNRPATLDETTWLPVPQGTKISVSQIYSLPSPGGVRKTVEQYVGYGNVIDEKGYFRCRITPENQPIIWLRVVADTIANAIDVSYVDKEQTIIDKLHVGPSRATVTPHGRRVFRSISHTFRVAREKDASVIRRGKDADGSEQIDYVHFYRPIPGQQHQFVAAGQTGVEKILIPYFGYETALDPQRRSGISIDWEGELSSGGYINFLSVPPSSFEMGVGALGIGVGMNPTRVYDELYAHSVTQSPDFPGITYHNHNELLHVLGSLVRTQEYVTRLAFFDPQSTTMRAAPDDTDADADADSRRPKLPGVIAYWRPKLRLSEGETGYVPFDGGVYRLVIQAAEEDPDERDVGLILRGYGAAVRHQFFRRSQQQTTPGDAQRRQDNAPPRGAKYQYGRRTSLEQAWQQGFDIFFAAAVLGSPKVQNRFAVEEKARGDRSVNLQEVLQQARLATGSKITQAEYRRLRGADNPIAVAAGLWRASQELSAERIVSALLWQQGGSLERFLRLVRDNRPDLLKDMAALGLCPLGERWPSSASTIDRLDPHAVKVVWHGTATPCHRPPSSRGVPRTSAADACLARHGGPRRRHTRHLPLRRRRVGTSRAATERPAASDRHDRPGRRVRVDGRSDAAASGRRIRCPEPVSLGTGRRKLEAPPDALRAGRCVRGDRRPRPQSGADVAARRTPTGRPARDRPGRQRRPRAARRRWDVRVSCRCPRRVEAGITTAHGPGECLQRRHRIGSGSGRIGRCRAAGPRGGRRHDPLDRLRRRRYVLDPGADTRQPQAAILRVRAFRRAARRGASDGTCGDRRAAGRAERRGVDRCPHELRDLHPQRRRRR